MCIVCIDLIKHNMTLLEAERNLDELGRTEDDKRLVAHYRALYEAIEKMDTEELGALLEEG